MGSVALALREGEYMLCTFDRGKLISSVIRASSQYCLGLMSRKETQNRNKLALIHTFMCRWTAAPSCSLRLRLLTLSSWLTYASRCPLRVSQRVQSGRVQLAGHAAFSNKLAPIASLRYHFSGEIDYSRAQRYYLLSQMPVEYSSIRSVMFTIWHVTAGSYMSAKYSSSIQQSKHSSFTRYHGIASYISEHSAIYIFDCCLGWNSPLLYIDQAHSRASYESLIARQYTTSDLIVSQR